jgi:L-fuconolactonase
MKTRRARFSETATQRFEAEGLHGLAMRRRDFLKAAALSAMALSSGCASLAASSGREVIDCHTHFYDPTRPQGVPWPGKNETQLYRPVMPRHYKALAVPHGVTGTIVVEASGWFEDNQWILDLAKEEPFIKGFIGNLSPGAPDFRQGVQRFARDPLFRGIRISFGEVPKLNDPARLRELGALVDHDLSLDLNGGVDSLETVVVVARALPELRIIINHVANVRIDGGLLPENWRKGMRQVAAQPNIFCKVSGLVEGAGRRSDAPRDLNFYLPVLDHVWDCFGQDRIIYGSNWPVSELFAEFATVHGIAQDYISAKGPVAERKFFAENARRIYKWLART